MCSKLHLCTQILAPAFDLIGLVILVSYVDLRGDAFKMHTAAPDLSVASQRGGNVANNATSRSMRPMRG